MRTFIKTLKHGTKNWILFTEAMWFVFEINKNFIPKLWFFILAEKLH